MSDVRFYPVTKDTSYYEHMHRYLFARKFVEGKKVLDISCGEGYGSNLLSEVANEVTGCDIDEEIVKCANEKYKRDNLQFVQGDCTDMQFADNSFDVVVSFETIEHIHEQEKFIEHASRVLNDKGIFIVSTPDKKIYTDDRDFHNSDHVKELYKEEFILLLKEKFKNVRVYGERFLRSSFIGEIGLQKNIMLGYCSETVQEAVNAGGYKPVSSDTCIEPMYIILVCNNNDEVCKEVENTFYFDADTDTEFNLARIGIADLEKQVSRAREVIEKCQQELQVSRDTIDKKEDEIEQARIAMENFQGQLKTSQEAITKLEQELEIARQTINGKNKELEQARVGMEDMQGQIEKSRDVIGMFEQELEIARETINSKNAELEQARVGMEDMQAQIENAQKAIAELMQESDAKEK